MTTTTPSADSKDQPMRIWITHNGIIGEIKGADVVSVDTGARTQLVYRHPDGVTLHYYYPHQEGRVWHRTKEDAINRSELMRADRVAELELEIERLRALVFA